MKKRLCLHSVDGYDLWPRGSLSIGTGGHFKKRTGGPLCVGISTFGLNKKTPNLTCFSVKYINDGDRKKIISVKGIDSVDILNYRLGVIDNVNSEKKVIHIVGNDYQLVVPQDRFFKKFSLGETFEVAYSPKKGKDGKLFYQFIHAKRTDAKSNLIVEFEGVLSIKENAKGQFGIVDDTYVPNRFLNGFTDGDYLYGKGIKDAGKIRIISLKKKERL